MRHSMSRFPKSSSWWIAVIVLCAVLAASPALSGEFGVYSNARFGYSIAYPLFLVPGGESDNGDGQGFFSEDGQSRLLVFAGFNVLETPLAEEYASALSDMHRKVTYKVLKKDRFVVSGYEGGRIFYQKTVLKRDTYFTFDLLYPEERRQEFDALIKPIADSFTIH